MAGKRYLIVNADDFGLCPGVNQGIIEAYEQGIVTSASLMVRGQAAREAAAYARKNPGLSLGLHFDIGEWFYRDGDWVAVYEVVPKEDVLAISEEATRQLTMFNELIGRKPSHIDSHQHVHFRGPAHSILVELTDRIGVPLRHFNSTIHYCGDFYGQSAEGVPFLENISVEGLLKILAALPSGTHTTELACHPGRELNDIETMYRSERAKELATLCDPRIRQALHTMNFELRSFNIQN